MSENENNIAQSEYQYIASVRFANSKKPYTFGSNDQTLEYGNHVVVETARGLEMGELISSLRERESYHSNMLLKPILRKASFDDLRQFEENKKMAKEALTKCGEAIIKLNLDMNLISCEYTLDRTKIIFVYVAEERVDFRELLKNLTQIFKCRIELRQVGPRDKAKMIGGLGACGLETCCSRFLESFDVVSISMAKNQLLALNIPKLSGQCGKLMCCLKFEDAQYTEMRQGLPKMNAQLEYEGKLYRLTSMNVITRQCKIENRENALFLSIDELMKKAILRKGVQGQPNQKKKAEDKSSEVNKEKKVEQKNLQNNKPEQKSKAKNNQKPPKEVIEVDENLEKSKQSKPNRNRRKRVKPKTDE